MLYLKDINGNENNELKNSKKQFQYKLYFFNLIFHIKFNILKKNYSVVLKFVKVKLIKMIY